MSEKQAVVIDLDEVTCARLVRFARAINEHPRSAAARLLQELLADDEFYNAAAEEHGPAH